MHLQQLRADLAPVPRDVWLGAGQRLVCAVHAWDPDGRSVHSPERAARFGARLVDALSPELDGHTPLEGLADDACQAALADIGGIFEPLVLAATRGGLWVAGRGRMEVLQLGRPQAEPVHASDALFWSRPELPEHVSAVVTHVLSAQTPDLQLRCRMLSPAPDGPLVVFLGVPTGAERAAVEAGEAAALSVLAAPRATPALVLTVCPDR